MLCVFPTWKCKNRLWLGWPDWYDLKLQRHIFGRISPHIYFAHGYSGHGVALTGLAGQLAEAILGDDERLSILKDWKSLLFMVGRIIKDLATKIGVRYYKFLDKYR